MREKDPAHCRAFLQSEIHGRGVVHAGPQFNVKADFRMKLIIIAL